MFDLICLAVIGVAAAFGWRRGFLPTVLGLAGLFGGYVLAWLLNKPLGGLLSATFGWQPVIARPTAGLLVIVVFVIAMGFVQRTVRRGRIRKELEGWSAPIWDRAGGAAVNGLWAGMIALLVAWVLIWLHGLAPQVPDVRDSVVGKTASRLVGAAAYGVTRGVTGNDAVAGTVAAIARDPQGGAQSLGDVLSHDKVRTALGNPETREAVARGDATQLRPLAQDERLLEDAYAAGLIKEDPRGLSPAEREQALAEGLGPIAGVVQELAEDEGVRELLADPELRQKLQDGNMAELAGDPRFNELANRVMAVMKEKGDD